MVREPNACMCKWDCKSTLRLLRTVCIPFATNRNLSIFCANTKRTACTDCPFHAPGILYSPQLCGRLINRAPRTHCMQTAQSVSSSLMYIKLVDWQTYPALPYFDNSAAVPDTPKKPYFDSDSRTFFCFCPPPMRMNIEWNYWIIRRFPFHLIFPLFIKF